MKIAFTNCTVLDGTEDMSPMENAVIIVEGSKILSVNTNNHVPSDASVINLGGRFLMPGLINLHVHLPSSGKPKSANDNPDVIQKAMKNSVIRKILKRMCYKYAKMELLSGVTTIRTVGGLGNLDSVIRNEINSGGKTGPRMLVSNMAISVPGGHMADVLAYSAISKEDAVQYVNMIAADHPDLIKLMITGGVLDASVKGEPGVLRMPADYVKAACDEAHKLGYKVAAHVESPEGIQVALAGGVETIEHGAVLDEKSVFLFQERKANLVCTISPTIPMVFIDPDILKLSEFVRYNGKVVFEGIISAAKTALKNNIPVGLGNDSGCPYVTHHDMWREVVYFHQFVGVSKKFALHTATQKNAEILGIEKETGSIQLGKCADFLITERNPLEDLSALRKPYMVVTRGKVLKLPRVKASYLVSYQNLLSHHLILYALLSRCSLQNQMMFLKTGKALHK